MREEVAASTEPNPLLEAALDYASHGISVFPARIRVRGEGKKDVQPIASWKEASTTDPLIIRSWWQRGGSWAGEAVCIDTGKSGLIGVDQDVSDGKRGPAEWEEVGQKSELRVITGSGGYHDYFRADPDHPITVDNTGAVADGVDVRGMGGFLFAPPSVDPRGGSWRWEAEPDWSELPDVPAVVVERVEKAQASRRPKIQNPPEPSGSQLFMQPSASYGPGAGFKTRRAAGELLMGQLNDFARLTVPGSGRSHILAQSLGVLAGHGVGVFWTYADALEALMTACQANGFIAEHTEAYAQQQAERGLEYGMLQRWTELPELVTDALQVTPCDDAVSALMAEMLTPDELSERPAPQPLIKGLYNLDSVAWVIGAPGSKKSFVVLDQAAHVARGAPWQGLKVHQGPVVMIVAEGAGGMSTRVKAWQARHGAIGGALRVLPRPVQAADALAWEVLVQACGRLEPVMVVIDTQARVTVGLEENSAKDMGVFVEAAERIRQVTGACVAVVHHTGRNGADARGSSAIDGAQGTELKVVRQDSMTGALKVEKQKDLVEREDMPLHFERVVVGVDEDGDEISSLVLLPPGAFRDLAGTGDAPEEWEVRHPGVQAQIIRALRDQGMDAGLTKAETKRVVADRWYSGRMGRAVGLRTSTYVTAWNTLQKKELITNVGGERWALDEIALESESGQ